MKRICILGEIEKFSSVRNECILYENNRTTASSNGQKFTTEK